MKICHKRTLLFPRSFDPFTKGHLSIVERGLKIADRIVVAVGINEAKRCMFSAEERVNAIKGVFAADERISVVTYGGLTVDAVKESDADGILRGVRTLADFEYERNMADMNRMLAGIETVLLFSEPELACISSSALRELIKFGRDISPFIPEGLMLPKK